MRPGLAARLCGDQPYTRWYGVEPHWQVWVEAAARREHGAALWREVALHRVTYRLPVEVRGRRWPVNVGIEFHPRPPYATYGLPPEEYPRVFADPGADSPHRMPDDALCLYFPHSSTAARWTPAKGLLALFDVTRDHLFFEGYWRSTGGHRSGVWLGDEQPHGFPERRSA